MLCSKNIVLLNLIFFTVALGGVTSQKSCASVQCSVPGNEPEITYPFGNKDLQGIGCGFPGFDITCDIHDHTVLKLPQSGEFLVRKIDYAKKEIRLYDQKNCLARRLQRKSISTDLSPFKAYAYKKYHFFSCPTSVTRSNPDVGTIAIIPCLSNATNSVLVTVSLGGDVDSYTAKVLIAGGCEICASVTIPIPFTAIAKISSYDFRIDDLYLTWVEPEKSEDSTKGTDDIKGREGKKSIGKLVGMIVGITAAIAAGLAGLDALTIKIVNNCNSNNINGNNHQIARESTWSNLEALF
ncbi:putative RING-H2 finger protein ATL21A [Papaver somniferum]|uniref:putative RING-H2 finger protein ATL21A n=1 Tax=Papaver somniferum TaxID=3469 RepID=UPI000E7022BE|nr:putative RING-H2 finger protein ATL21A [Papaver somniferum]